MRNNNSYYSDIVTFPSLGIEENAVKVTVSKSTPMVSTGVNIEEFIKTIIGNLDLSVSEAYNPHMLEVDTTVNTIMDLFKKLDPLSVGSIKDFSDAWKWSNSTDKMSPVSIYDTLNNTYLVLERFLTMCDDIYQSFGGYYRDADELNTSKVVNLTKPLEQVNGFNIIGGFKIDINGRLNLLPSNNEVKCTTIGKKDVDKFNSLYKEIYKQLEKFNNVYNKCKKKFLHIKNDNKKLVDTNLSFVLNTFSDIVGSFISIRRLAGIDYGKMIMAVKKSIK